MSTHRSFLLYRVSLYASAVLLLLTLWWTASIESSGSVPAWSQFVGRFHPVTLHAPIGLFVGLFALEIIGLFKRGSGMRQAANLLLGLVVITSVVAACLGLLLFANGEYTGLVVFRHKWLGFGFAVGTLVLAGVRLKVLGQGAFPWKVVYPLLLTGLLVVMSAAGHYGGSLTHGSSYLFEYAPEWLKQKMEVSEGEAEPAPAEAEDRYRATVDPVLQEYCVKCHGPEKQKSDYRLDTYEHMLMPGRDEETPIVAWEPHNSYLVQLLWLHESDEMAMPPEGKARPSAEQILAISHWVSLGAPAPREVAEERRARLEAEARLKKAVVALEESGVVVLPQGQEEDVYYVDFLNVAEPLTEEAWGQLVVLKDRIGELKLAETRLSTNQWSQLANAARLTDLHTGHITSADEVVAALNALPALKRLNMYGSDLTSAGLQQLDVSRLSNLYLGETSVSNDVIVALREAHPDIDIHGVPDLAGVDAIEEASKQDSTRFDPTQPKQE